ncbi:TrbL/VirB6 family protein [Anaplasma phagocytophilum]|uniref:type IV secretion system protein n=1 Tax=Anaplasma phagocytophilum TaxID=948 RepID=UPI0007E0C38E|nr:type IV secretion system protein [Anaplasma phagocytophilum]SBO31886.1 TrbL/VirB6 plasmid conjugal transfer protein [Anaplasma phagocytophilum]SBO32069.1 TrbL/VirB6 plasmid conjugal transfer protein [Anaplasma phagocytophilum]SBO32361.1 TrbL/VirB6 plasmid conjugal transfer protein [Anaplasma phagocytophilum]SCV61818.1 TrbL/VirB6 plasmid conjugal transfer protein [Anaplasma phagocytophilum]
MHRVARALVFLMFLVVTVPLTSYAAGDATGGAAKGEESNLVHYRHAEATNPRCGAVEELAKIGGKGIAAALGGGITGVGLLYVPFAGFRAFGFAMIAASIATISAGIAASTPYFACNWSFVRHPVLRFESADDVSRAVRTDGNEQPKEGDYKECSEPISATDIKGLYEGECNKEFADMASYYACLAKDKSLEDAQRAEPTCPGKKFKKAQKYAWPKNRVSSSRYIEVCYRHPLGTIYISPYVAARLGFAGEDPKEVLKRSKYPRESTFGDYDMQSTKLTVSGAWAEYDNIVKCKTLKAGQEDTMHGVTFRAVERGAKLCVDAVKLSGVPFMAKPEIGCQMRPNSPPSPMCAQSKRHEVKGTDGITVVSYDNSGCYSCYVAETCKGVANLNSRSIFPITSVVVGCVVDSLKNLLNPPAGCTGRAKAMNSVNPGFLKVAQEKLKKTVMAALILALILFSIKAVLGGVQNAGELYMTVLKFALVIYFTQGDAMSTAYDYLTRLSIGLSDIVLRAAGGDTGICDFKASDYDPKYLYLMPWDRLDCRMMFYLGSQLTGGTGTGILLSVLLTAGLLIPAILINAKVIVCLVALFAVIMLILTIIWTVYVFLLSLIALTVLTIISPLMIPMSLFQATKGFFDGWTRQLMTYSLYPVILFAFLSLMFAVFDNLYFGNLKFHRGAEEGAVSGAPTAGRKIWFELEDKKACEKPENETNIACMFDTMQFFSRPLVFGISVSAPEFKMATTAQIWTKLGVFVLIGFLFYHFLGSISYIAGELAGDPRAGVIGSGGMNPRSIAHKAAGMASAIRGAASGKLSDLGSKARDAIKGGGSSDGGTDKVSGGSSGGDSGKGGDAGKGGQS